MSTGTIPKYIREGLSKQGPATLRAIAERAQELADKKRAEVVDEIEEQSIDEDEYDVDPDELGRREAPATATLVTKNIDDRDYFYWNWRDGSGSVKSEYIRPVVPSNNS